MRSGSLTGRLLYVGDVSGARSVRGINLIAEAPGLGGRPHHRRGVAVAEHVRAEQLELVLGVRLQVVQRERPVVLVRRRWHFQCLPFGLALLRYAVAQVECLLVTAVVARLPVDGRREVGSVHGDVGGRVRRRV